MKTINPNTRFNNTVSLVARGTDFRGVITQDDVETSQKAVQAERMDMYKDIQKRRVAAESVNCDEDHED